MFAVIADTPQHTYQVLTKRSSRLRRSPTSWTGRRTCGWASRSRTATRSSASDDLRTVPAAVRFLSCEPLIGPLEGLDLDGIGWVIAGGESGPGQRPLDPDWVTGIRDRCVRREVPFFFKQWGGQTPKAGGRELDGRYWDQMPISAAPAAS